MITQLVIPLATIENDAYSKIQSVLNKYSKERKRRLFVDGEVITESGRFVDAEGITEREILIHPRLEAAEYKARYMMLASGEPTERLERVAKAAKDLADAALEMARTNIYPLHQCVDLIHAALGASLKIEQARVASGVVSNEPCKVQALKDRINGV